jgi:hypothetical protein
MKTRLHTLTITSIQNIRPNPLKTMIGSILLILVLFGVTVSKTYARNTTEIIFNLKYGMMKGGEAKMIVRDTVFNGKKAIHYYMEGKTTGVTDVIFKVHDIYESIVDAETHLPMKAIRNIKERSYRYYNEVYFYQNNDSIYSKRTGGIKVPHELTDIISVLFYFVNRNYIHNIEEGKLVVLPVINGHDIGQIKIKHSGIQTVDTGMGKVECYLLSPEIEKGKVLKRSDGLSFFISKKNKVPVLLDIDLRVGTLRAVIDSYKVNGKKITNL